MGENTKIEWADHTFNPWMGCSKVSEGCRNCYAENQMDHRWNKVQWGPGKPRARTSEAMWRKPLQWNAEAKKTGIRPRVFSLSLGDWLDPEVPIEWLADFLALIQKTPDLNWLLVTKRPELWDVRLHEAMRVAEGPYDFEISHWLDGAPPENVWTLASVENQEATKRIPHLLEIPAVVHGLSCEPLVGALDLTHIEVLPHVYQNGKLKKSGIHLNCLTGQYFESGVIDHAMRLGWIICGGESGQNARPMHPDWARSLRDDCQTAGVPYHFKQWGEFQAVYDRDLDASWSQVNNVKGQFSTGRWVNLEGGHGFHGDRVHWMVPVGKKAAGRLLDGREWNELPEVAHG